MRSAEFLAFSARLNGLAQNLPAANIAKNALNPVDLERITFFGITAHATCEEFIEQRCLSVAGSAFNKFKSNGFFGRIARHLCLMSFLSIKDVNDVKKLSNIIGLSGFGIHVSSDIMKLSNIEINDLLDLGYKKYISTVNSNHGIGIKYQFHFMSCIGLDIVNVSPTFSSRVQQLTTLRGEAAHKSSVAAKTTPEPSDLVKWATDLLVGYEDLDKKLSELQRKIR